MTSTLFLKLFVLHINLFFSSFDPLSLLQYYIIKEDDTSEILFYFLPTSVTGRRPCWSTPFECWGCTNRSQHFSFQACYFFCQSLFQSCYVVGTWINQHWLSTHMRWVRIADCLRTRESLCQDWRDKVCSSHVWHRVTCDIEITRKWLLSLKKGKIRLLILARPTTA